MTDFKACEITPNGVSIKIGNNRTAIGVGDFKDRAAYIEAVSDLLEKHLSAQLADIVASAAADKTYGTAAIDAANAQLATANANIDAIALEYEAKYAAEIKAKDETHAAEVAELEAYIKILGTKEEAQALRKQLEANALEATIANSTAQLEKLRKEIAIP